MDSKIDFYSKKEGYKVTDSGYAMEHKGNQLKIVFISHRMEDCPTMMLVINNDEAVHIDNQDEVRNTLTTGGAEKQRDKDFVSKSAMIKTFEEKDLPPSCGFF